MLYVIALSLVGNLSLPSAGQAEDNDDFALLLRMASQGYVQGSMRVASLVDNNALAKIVDKEGELSDLASLISARMVINAAHVEESSKGWRRESQIVRDKLGKAAMRTIRDNLIQKAAEKGLALLGISVNPAVAALLLANDIRQWVQTAAETQAEVEAWRDSQGAKVHRYGYAAWVYEALIATEIKNRVEKKATNSVRFDDSFSATPTVYEHRYRPFCAFKIHNNAQRLKWAFVIMRIDCEYNGPVRSELDRAFQKNSNVDKVMPFYVEKWERNQSITLVGTPAAEYFHTAKSVELFVYTASGRSSKKLKITRHKEELRKRFAPSSNVQPFVDSKQKR